jgi:hypothetical protein
VIQIKTLREGKTLIIKEEDRKMFLLTADTGCPKH